MFIHGIEVTFIFDLNLHKQMETKYPHPFWELHEGDEIMHKNIHWMMKVFYVHP